MYQIVTQMDKCDSMSCLTLLLSLSSTFHATVKLLDLRLQLQAEAHGQVSGMRLWMLKSVQHHNTTEDRVVKFIR